MVFLDFPHDRAKLADRRRGEMERVALVIITGDGVGLPYIEIFVHVLYHQHVLRTHGFVDETRGHTIGELLLAASFFNTVERESAHTRRKNRMMIPTRMLKDVSSTQMIMTTTSRML